MASACDGAAHATSGTDAIADHDLRAFLARLEAEPVRDSVLIHKLSADHLAFSSHVPNPGSRLWLDATNKWPAETSRTWSTPIRLDPAVERRVDALWQRLAD